MATPGAIVLSLIDGTLTAQRGSTILTGAGLPNADWTHVAVTYSGAVMTLYLNGVPTVHTHDTSTAPAPGRICPVIGAALTAAGSSGNVFLGYIQYVTIWNRALNDAQVQGLMYNDPTFQDGCLSNFSFSQTNKATFYGTTLKTEKTLLVGTVTSVSSTVRSKPKSVRAVSVFIVALSRRPEFMTWPSFVYLPSGEYAQRTNRLFAGTFFISSNSIRILVVPFSRSICAFASRPESSLSNLSLTVFSSSPNVGTFKRGTS